MKIPLAYADLTLKEKEWMCNGCGPKFGKFPNIVPEFIFHEACEHHDFDYWSGFSEGDRTRADTRFLNAMLEAAKMQSSWWLRQWYTFLAWHYYSVVRWTGAKAFSFRSYYATREDLACEMSQDP